MAPSTDEIQDRMRIEPLLAAAVLAPSSHNTQPWLFVCRGPSIDLLADRRRALAVNDPEDRELTISCGCALLNLRVAAAHAGFEAKVTVLARARTDARTNAPTSPRTGTQTDAPADADPDHLARIEPVPATSAQPDARLYPALAARRTQRRRFRPEPLDAPTQQALVDAARLEGAVLHLLATDEQRQAAAQLVAEGDALQWADPSWRRELAAWMHPRRTGDGLSMMPALALPLAHAVVRSFDMGAGVGAKDRQLTDESPLLAVLATPGDGIADWLAAGQALERVLLEATSLGLQASFLNQPIQRPTLRPRLRQLVGCSGQPQLLLRLGRPLATVPATPRRPLAEVIVDG